MDRRIWRLALLPGVLVLSSTSCADVDNPTALSETELTAEVEIPSHLHSLTTYDLHFRVLSNSEPVHLHDVQVEVVPPGGGPSFPVPVETTTHAFEAQFYLFASGEHHLRISGQPEGHHLGHQLWEEEVHVARTHIVSEGHRFELETEPAPIMPGSLALLHLFAFELEEDGTKGDETPGLALTGFLHFPDATGVRVEWDEHGHGEYEARAVFPGAGEYGLQVGLQEEDHVDEEEGHDNDHSEFHIRVPSATNGAPSPEEGNGHEH